MRLSKLIVLLQATLVLCGLFVTALPVFGDPSGDARVREAQTLLTEQNYKPGPIDGILGPRTLSAILRFQIDRDLPPTRELDDVTLETLRAAAVKRESQANGESPAAGPAQTSPPVVPLESVSEAESGIGGNGTKGVARTEPSETAAIPERPAPTADKTDRTVETMPFPRTEVQAGQSLVQDDELVATDARDQAESALGAVQPGEAASESLYSFLPSELNIENVLFVGLLIFAAVAVIAAIYTSIRGKETKAPKQQTAAEEETVLASPPEEDLEATVIAPVEPTVATPPETPLTPRTEATATSPTEFARPYAHGATSPAPEDVTQAVRTELYAELEPEPKSQKDELNKPVRNDQPQEDPLADLNIHLAFERFDQAEALVKDAIERYPQRHEYLLRLLEVYTAARNPLAFEFYARALRDAVGHKSPLLATALRWWDTLSPERPLFEAPLEEKTRRL